MITDDARIVDAQSCQLESWSRRGPGGHESWALPGCNPWGSMEITAGGAQLDGSGGASPRLALLQAKTLFRRLEDSPVAYGLALGMTQTRTPSGAYRTLNEPYAYVPVTVTVVPDRAFVHLNAGLRRDAAASRLQSTWGLGLEAAITPRVGVIAEAFAQDAQRSYHQAGLRIWLVPDRWQIDTTLGNRNGQHPGQGPDRWVSVGVRLLSPPWLR